MEKEFRDAVDPGTLSGTSDETMSMNESHVFKVGVRVPPFWAEEPEIWFAQVEGQFSMSGITSDSTKFNYVIAHLDNQHSREVKDIIVDPPATQKYEKLKTELIKRLSASNEKKIKQLLMHEELGDRKPSQFLRHLKGLAGTEVPDDFLKTIWTSRLPHGVQAVLAGQPIATSLEDLADLADRVNDLASPTPKVASVSNVPASLLNSFVNSSRIWRRTETADLSPVLLKAEETLLRGSASDLNQTIESFHCVGTTASTERRPAGASAHVTTSRKTQRAVANGG